MSKLPRISIEVSGSRVEVEPFIKRHLETFRGLGALMLILISGGVGFKLIEGETWSWLDAFYMAIITTSTVGFAEVKELSEGGRIFAIVVIVFGVSAYVYMFATLGEYMISGQVLGDFTSRRARRMLEKISGHHILVGYGSTGSITAAEFSSRSTDEVVVIDVDRTAVNRAVDDGHLAILGDAGRDDVLLQAGVTRAASLMCVAAPDSAGVMAVLTARNLAPQLQIIARATLPDAAPKLMLAGATSVVSAHHIAGERIAEQVASPKVSGFIDIDLHGQFLELRWGECELSSNSPHAGKTLQESDLNSDLDAIIVAIRKSGSEVYEPIDAHTVLGDGDVLVFVGTQSYVEQALQVINAR